MKKFLMAAVALLAATAAQAAPFLQVTVRQGTGVVQGTKGVDPLITTLTTQNFTVKVQTGIVDAATPSIDLDTSILARGGGGRLTVTFSVQGLTSLVDANAWLTQFSGNWATPNTTVTLATYIADNNGLVNTTNNALPSGAVLLSTLNGGSSPFATQATSGTTSTTNTFSLIEVLTVITTGPGTMSFDGSITRVPEPMSIVLFGAGLLGLGGLTRHGRRDA